MTKIVCISDTHAKHRQIDIPDGDILICAGDITMRGEIRTLCDFNNWLGELPHKKKIICSGNHEIGLGNMSLTEKRNIFSNGIYLEDEQYSIDKLKFWFSPWTPYFYDWEFNFPRNSYDYNKLAHKTWAKIPDDTNMLVTHGPAYGILDKVNNPRPGEDPNVGCKFLLERISQLKGLKYHIFGHVHEGFSVKKLDNYIAVNAAILNDQYEVQNKPIVIEL